MASCMCMWFTFVLLSDHCHTGLIQGTQLAIAGSTTWKFCCICHFIGLQNRHGN